jgi:hypothetical protein
MSAVDPGATAPETAPETQPEGQPTEPTTQAQQPDGLDRLHERMEAMSRQQAQLLEGFQQLTQPPEEEPDESMYYTDEGDLTEDGARAVIADLVREQVESQLGPREAARMVEMRDDAYEALRDEYPELQDDKTSERVLAKAVRWAQTVHPEIIDRPEFVDVIEAFYKADKYEEVQQAHAAEQPRPVVLESGSGARQQTRNEPDWGDRIVKAAERLRPQI